MRTVSAQTLSSRSNAWNAILAAGLLAGIMDISAAFIQFGLRGRSPVRLLQLVASGLLGADAYDTPWTAIPGALLHFFIAMTAAAVYHIVSRKWKALISHAGVFGSLYGIAVYLVMNFIVLPLSAFPHKLAYPPVVLITGLTIHIFCIGLPIALMNRRYMR